MLLRISTAIFLIIFTSIVNSSCLWRRTNIDESSLKSLINTELPNGVSKEHVSNFLTAKKIAHSNYSQDLPNNYDFNSPRLEGKRDLITGFIIGNVPNIRRSFLLTYELQIFFYFDKNDRLIEYSVREVGMGF